MHSQVNTIHTYPRAGRITDHPVAPSMSHPRKHAMAAMLPSVQVTATPKGILHRLVLPF